jgi:molybdopterin-guanine dinucleotide biosynthesis protein A
VLCGGRSSRMGRDKALIPIDGRPMALRVATALMEAGAAEVVAVGGDAGRLSALGLDVVRDAAVVPDPGGTDVGSRPWLDEAPMAGGGPLVGIVTALAALTDEVVMVAACDLVAPSAEAMAATVAALASAPGYDVAVPHVPDARPAGIVPDPGDSGGPGGPGGVDDPGWQPNRRPGAAGGVPPGGLVPQWLHAAWQREAWSSLAGQLAAGERAVHRAVAAAGLRVVDVGGLGAAALADADVPSDLPPPAGHPPE